MRCNLGFSRTGDGQLLVLAEVLDLRSPNGSESPTVTRFSDENVFLYYVVLADFDDEVTTSLISNVLLVLSGKCAQATWTSFSASERQLRGIGLNIPHVSRPQDADAPCDFPNDLHFRDVLMQAPTPVTMLAGAQHEFSFVNPAFVRLMGRSSVEAVLGKTVREVLPELQGQPYFGLLDKVYRTGKPYVGKEIPASIQNENSGELEEHYFDFVYHPVRDSQGEVCGILSQASDVTERVLTRHVSEAREAQLYRQWAELEAVYRNSPVGMAIVDTAEYKIVRINEVGAAFIKATVQEAIGKKIFDLYPDFEELRQIYFRVAAGEEVRNVHIEVHNKPETADRCYHLNFSPVFGPDGRVEAIASTTTDITRSFEPELRLVIDRSVQLLLSI